jgi:hypothetical protein
MKRCERDHGSAPPPPAKIGVRQMEPAVTGVCVQIGLSSFRLYGAHTGWLILSVSLKHGRIGEK